MTPQEIHGINREINILEQERLIIQQNCTHKKTIISSFILSSGVKHKSKLCGDCAKLLKIL